MFGAYCGPRTNPTGWDEFVTSSLADNTGNVACADIGAPHSGQNAFCSGTDAPHLEHFAIHEFSAPSVNE